MDLHRRRSVMVRMTEDGRKLETVRIANSPAALRAVIARCGEAPDGGHRGDVRLVLGRGRAASRRGGGAPGASAGRQGVQLPAGQERRAGRPDLADLLRMGRLPEAWIAPPEIRELRELTRYRHKLVGRAPAARTRCTRCWPSSASRSRIRTSSACTGRRGWTS